jgi:hypothetical protein
VQRSRLCRGHDCAEVRANMANYTSQFFNLPLILPSSSDPVSLPLSLDTKANWGIKASKSPPQNASLPHIHTGSDSRNCVHVLQASVAALSNDLQGFAVCLHICAENPKIHRLHRRVGTRRFRSSILSDAFHISQILLEKLSELIL